MRSWAPTSLWTISKSRENYFCEIQWVLGEVCWMSSLNTDTFLILLLGNYQGEKSLSILNHLNTWTALSETSKKKKNYNFCRSPALQNANPGLEHMDSPCKELLQWKRVGTQPGCQHRTRLLQGSCCAKRSRASSSPTEGKQLFWNRSALQPLWVQHFCLPRIGISRNSALLREFHAAARWRRTHILSSAETYHKTWQRKG